MFRPAPWLALHRSLGLEPPPAFRRPAAGRASRIPRRAQARSGGDPVPRPRDRLRRAVHAKSQARHRFARARRRERRRGRAAPAERAAVPGRGRRVVTAGCRRHRHLAAARPRRDRLPAEGRRREGAAHIGRAGRGRAAARNRNAREPAHGDRDRRRRKPRPALRPGTGPARPAHHALPRPGRRREARLPADPGDGPRHLHDPVHRRHHRAAQGRDPLDPQPDVQPAAERGLRPLERGARGSADDGFPAVPHGGALGARRGAALRLPHPADPRSARRGLHLPAAPALPAHAHRRGAHAVPDAGQHAGVPRGGFLAPQDRALGRRAAAAGGPQAHSRRSSARTGSPTCSA